MVTKKIKSNGRALSAIPENRKNSNEKFPFLVGFCSVSRFSLEILKGLQNSSLNALKNYSKYA
jgi:hypothetical protein